MTRGSHFSWRELGAIVAASILGTAIAVSLTGTILYAQVPTIVPAISPCLQPCPKSTWTSYGDPTTGRKWTTVTTVGVRAPNGGTRVIDIIPASYDLKTAIVVPGLVGGELGGVGTLAVLTLVRRRRSRELLASGHADQR